MPDFQYADIKVSVEPLQKKEGTNWTEYGIKIEAPGRGPYAFRSWYPEEREFDIVAQVVLYDLIEAYEDPKRFVKRKGDEKFPEKTTDFLRAAVELAPYLHAAHLAVYKSWAKKPLKSDKGISRPPKEWMPFSRPRAKR